MGKKRNGLAYVVDPNTGCWEWQGYKQPKGYGRMRHPETDELVLSHRFYYEQANGPVPDHLQLDHLCRNRGCCNPAHLEAVTQSVNVRRGRTGRLTDDAVRFIIRSAESSRALGRQFGVSKTSIQNVRRGRTWSDIYREEAGPA